MGTLHAADHAVRIDDHTLVHLAAVITAKLRRHEPFLLSYATSTGRESLWLHATSTLRYSYDAVEAPPLDRELLATMVRNTSRPGGLTITLEPSAPALPAAPAPLPTTT